MSNPAGVVNSSTVVATKGLELGQRGVGIMNRSFLLVLLAAGVLGGPALGDLLWDNNIEPDGYSGFQISPPMFPDWRWADDIVVPEPGWIVEGFGYNAIEDDDWLHSGTSEVYIYSDDDGEPGPLFVSAMGPHEREFTGESYFGRRDYEYRVQDLDVHLPAGQYWIGVRDPGGSGNGSNYIMSSDGGPDGGCPPDYPDGTCQPLYSSDDVGETWIAGGEHLAFEVSGVVVPEPGTLLLVAVGAPLLAGRQRRPCRGRSG